MSSDHYQDQEGGDDGSEVGFEEHVLTTLKAHTQILQGLHNNLDGMIENNAGILKIIDKLADRIEALEQSM